jgi:ribosomal protein S18 acetylase RimI-like enzyme
MSDVRVRTMEPGDLDTVGRLAGRLVRMHYEFDPKRFIHLTNPEPGYARWLGQEMKNDAVVLLVAEVDSGVVGYLYARKEPRNYNDLLDAHGKLHDVYVDESARGRGAGEALVREGLARLAKMGAPRVVLSTAVQNEAAHRLFERLGFRTTMLEMTAEL